MIGERECVSARDVICVNRWHFIISCGELLYMCKSYVCSMSVVSARVRVYVCACHGFVKIRKKIMMFHYNTELLSSNVNGRSEPLTIRNECAKVYVHDERRFRRNRFRWRATFFCRPLITTNFSCCAQIKWNRMAAEVMPKKIDSFIHLKNRMSRRRRMICVHSVKSNVDIMNTCAMPDTRMRYWFDSRLMSFHYTTSRNYFVHHRRGNMMIAKRGEDGDVFDK